MNPYVYSTAILLVLFGVAVIVVSKLIDDSDTIHRKLDEFAELAEKATTPQELAQIDSDLRHFCNVEVWHRIHADRARAVQQYIHGKFAGLKP